MSDILDSFFKKSASVIENGVDPIIVGKNNYDANIPDIEDLAIERAETCNTCRENKTEPISFFRVKDERIFAVSEKMCNVCGCALPFLIRQSEKICQKW